MITKAVTQDIYGNTHVYRWKVYTHSEKISTKCSKCGKTITKSVSFQYQGTPSQEDWDGLEKDKQKWLAEEHVCSKCLKEACKGEQGPLDMTQVNHALDEINMLFGQINALRKGIIHYGEQIQKELKGKVCIYEDKEYVINWVSTCDYNDMPLHIQCYKIDTRYPWTTTDTEMYITEKGGGFGNSKTVNAKWEDVIFTNEVFAERKARVKELYGEE